MADTAIKEQYRRLQEQQKRKLDRLRQLQSASDAKIPGPQESLTFGVEDDMGLIPTSHPPKQSLQASVSFDTAGDMIRQLKDENGRLYKLLSEKDVEIRQLKRKSAPAPPPSLGGGVSESTNGDIAAVRIMGLSKKLREMSCELEAEKNKSAQLAKKCRSLEDDSKHSKSDHNSPAEDSPGNALADELKQTKDKLRSLEGKLAEVRSQHQTASHDLKLALKALGDEVGEANVNPRDLLSGQTNWRGRQQRILTLTSRVKDLERQLQEYQFGSGSLTSPDLMVSETSLLSSGATSFGRTPSSGTLISMASGQMRQREGVVKLQKARQEALEKSEVDLKQLKEEVEDLRKKGDASKARNKVLSNEVKATKEKVQVLLEKGRHDDELIQTLLKQQSLLQSNLEVALSRGKDVEEQTGDKVAQMAVQREQEGRVVARLKEIIADKENQILKLHDKISAASGASVSHTPSTPPTARPISLSRGVSPIPLPPLSRAPSVTNRPSSRDQTIDREEVNTLLKAAEVERDRLRELGTVQEKRCEELIKKHIQVEQDNSTLRRRCTALERQVQRLGGSVPSSHPPIDADSDALLRDALPLTSESVISLQQALMLAKDENIALKQGVKRAMEAKREDLNMLTDIVSQTRSQFLQGIKNIKQQTSQTS